MATKDENQDETTRDGASAVLGDVVSSDTGERGEVSFDGAAPAQLGTEKYVQAAFFGAGVLVAYLTGKILGAIWNSLADWPAAVRAVPQLLSYAEDERGGVTMPLGLVVGIIAVVYTVRKPGVRQWADEVASELAKIHWPDRETVTNGALVVLIVTAFATVYVGLLDRLWGFVTNLIYGA
ncbi:MAG: hypothetical protein RJA70_3413 [Pseudomonadota bacterium]|jgi:preprotein translocase SecE subunit